MAKSPQSISTAALLGIPQMPQEPQEATGKKKAAQELPVATPPPPLEAPTWTPENLSPEARSDLLRAMMQRSRSMSQGPPANGGSSKGAQAIPEGS